MIERKCSIVKYREFSTHGSGRTTNNVGNNTSSPFDLLRKKSVVRFSISYLPCGDATKFNTKDNEIKSYPYPSTQSYQKTYFNRTLQRHKILLLNPWIPTLQIDPSHTPSPPLHSPANRIINVQTPYFKDSEVLCGGRFKPLDEEFGGIAAALNGLALGGGLLVDGEGD